MRAIALHEDVLVATSAVLHLNCAIVRGKVGSGDEPGEEPLGETFVVDSPVLPEELEALPALVAQARFPTPAGLVVTHGDWDHLLGGLAFPGLAVGCAQSTAERLAASPGEAQRELRAFDEDLLIERDHPLRLGSLQTLPVPGRCSVGERELELHPASGHTGEGMAVLVPWAGVLLAGDFLSVVELPALERTATLEGYLATLEDLRGLVDRVEHVVPGHGPVLDSRRALSILEEDRSYLLALRERGAGAPLPAGRQGAAQRRLHQRNVTQTER